MSFKHKHELRLCKSNLAILSHLTPRPTHYSTTASPKSYPCPTALSRNWNSLQLSYCQGVRLSPCHTPLLRFCFFPFPSCTCHIPPYNPPFRASSPGLSAPRSVRLLQSLTWALRTEFISADDPSVVTKSCGEQSSDLLPSICFKTIFLGHRNLSVLWMSTLEGTNPVLRPAWTACSISNTFYAFLINYLFYDNSCYWVMSQKERKMFSIRAALVLNS